MRATNTIEVNMEHLKKDCKKMCTMIKLLLYECELGITTKVYKNIFFVNPGNVTHAGTFHSGGASCTVLPYCICVRPRFREQAERR